MVAGDGRDLVAQLRRGVAEHCVLALLCPGERYGFDLARELAGQRGLVAGEGTVYPLLTRLRRRQLVETTWQESAEGPPRRYYRLTTEGKAELATFVEQWRQFRSAVDSVLEGAQ
ncbi:MAG: PadR family transcriptional regulator [Actinomycetota bacterium]|nr:PadR family transcriptional regulator [Actinomycetota bacterium]